MLRCILATGTERGPGGVLCGADVLGKVGAVLLGSTAAVVLGSHFNRRSGFIVGKGGEDSSYFSLPLSCVLNEYGPCLSLLGPVLRGGSGWGASCDLFIGLAFGAGGILDSSFDFSRR